METNKAPWLRGTFLFSPLNLVVFISKEDFIWKKLEKTSFVRVDGWVEAKRHPAYIKDKDHLVVLCYARTTKWIMKTICLVYSYSIPIIKTTSFWDYYFSPYHQSLSDIQLFNHFIYEKNLY